jgi:PhnB protein
MLLGPDGKIAHAELKLGDSVIMLSHEMPGSETRWPQSLGRTTSGVFLSVKDVAAVFHKATRGESQGCRTTCGHVFGPTDTQR